VFAFLFNQPKTWHLVFIYALSFALRGIVFYGYLQHNERYHQADSVDYHVSAWCLAHGFGMKRPDTGRSIFWRTPGYPYFLSLFFSEDAPSHADFASHASIHKKAIFTQIIFCSIIPVLNLFLTWLITQSWFVAWLVAFISVIHVGMVLAAGFLLTDAPASVFFTLFLLLFFSVLLPRKKPIFQSYWALMGAAFCLVLYTWMRPMGQFVAIGSAILLLLTEDKWKEKLKKSFLFLLLFFAGISPWFIRNYQLTGRLFFCPLFGLYFNVFNAPKILSRTTGKDLRECHSHLTLEAGKKTYAYMQENQRVGNPDEVVGELVCLETALPVILAHPFIFIYDWCIEVAKTTFDLYSYQLVSLHNNCFMWDPMIEYLPEKIAGCLYAAELPTSMRIISWLEALFYLFVWIGVFVGAITHVLIPIIRRNVRYDELFWQWFYSGIFIGMVVFQTGGFGYARLRLPIEALILTLGISFWIGKVSGRTYNKRKVYHL
jgi:hypothetical protein